jgi:hypothetical protein
LPRRNHGGVWRIAFSYETDEPLCMSTASSNYGGIKLDGVFGVAKGEQKGNREAKKPKKEKIKIIAAAPSRKIGGWQPSLESSKKK